MHPLICGIWTSLIIHPAPSSTVHCWGLKFSIETHSSHRLHHRKEADIFTSLLQLIAEVHNNEGSCRQSVLFARFGAGGSHREAAAVLWSQMWRFIPILVVRAAKNLQFSTVKTWQNPSSNWITAVTNGSNSSIKTKVIHSTHCAKAFRSTVVLPKTLSGYK